MSFTARLVHSCLHLVKFESNFRWIVEWTWTKTSWCDAANVRRSCWESIKKCWLLFWLSSADGELVWICILFVFSVRLCYIPKYCCLSIGRYLWYFHWQPHWISCDAWPHLSPITRAHNYVSKILRSIPGQLQTCTKTFSNTLIRNVYVVRFTYILEKISTQWIIQYCWQNLLLNWYSRTFPRENSTLNGKTLNHL